MFSLRQISAVLGTLALVVTFQHCSDLDVPGQGGATNLSSSSDPNDITLLSVPPNMTLYAGSSLSLQVAAESKKGLRLSYQWKKGGMDLVGQNAPTLTIASVSASDDGLYSVVVKNSADSETVQASVTISPTPVLTITSQPQPITISEGQDGVLSVGASVTPSQTLAYQWFKDGNALGGATGASLSVGTSSPARSGNYYVRVTTTSGPTQTANSNTVKITVSDTINVDAANGCVNGYCACNMGYGEVNPASGTAICQYRGYASMTGMSTRAGVRGHVHCTSPNGTGCFVNQNPINLVCTTVSCTR